jgi:hypothetical protein
MRATPCGHYRGIRLGQSFVLQGKLVTQAVRPDISGLWLITVRELLGCIAAAAVQRSPHFNPMGSLNLMRFQKKLTVLRSSTTFPSPRQPALKDDTRGDCVDPPFVPRVRARQFPQPFLRLETGKPFVE